MLEKKFELLVPSKLRALGSQAAQNGLVQKAADFSCRHGLRFCSFDCLSSDPSHTWRHIWAFALFTRETGGYVLLSGSLRALGIKYVKLLAQCHIMGTVGTMTRCHKVFTFSHNVSQFLPLSGHFVHTDMIWKRANGLVRKQLEKAMATLNTTEVT